jgi:hypothetical protein
MVPKSPIKQFCPRGHDTFLLLSILALFLSACSFIQPDDKRDWKSPTFHWHDYQPSKTSPDFDMHISGDTVKNRP